MQKRDDKSLSIFAMLILTSLFLIISLPDAIGGNEIKYKVIDIPEELRDGAYSVIRNNSIEYKRYSVSRAVLKVSKTITILNKKALNNAVLIQYYNKFSKVKNAKIWVYDEFGNLLKKKGKDDILDISAIDRGTLFSDARIKVIDSEYQTIPFTVEIYYEMHLSGILSTPTLAFYPGHRTSVEKSSFTIETSKEHQLRYYSVNTDIEPIKSEKKGVVTMIWEVDNLPPIKPEPFSLSFTEITPLIFSAPSNFSINNYNGDASSWNGFGKWISQLNKDRDSLPAETVSEIKSLLVDSLTEIEKVKLLYHWMQNKTRYVNIQIGIGGWQPIIAEDVDKYSYGDCKALSNYMQAILDVANIKSYYTLVRAGKTESNIIKEFPSNQFNHAILCVPIQSDTIWLECTNQTNPFGYLSSFTDDRDVLLITDNGGEIIHTKLYTRDDNWKISYANIKLDTNGDGSASLLIKNSGLYYDDRLPVTQLSLKKQNDFVVNNFDIPSFDLENYSYSEIKSIVPMIAEEMDLFLKSYASNTGSRIIFTPNILSKHDYQFSSLSKRKNNIFIRRETREIDTIVYKLPENYIVESIPMKIELVTKFGYYCSHVIVDSSQITYVRKFDLEKGNYEYNKYPKFKDFSTEIRKADNQKVVLVKKYINK